MYNRRLSIFYLLGCNKENQLNEIKCHLQRISVCRDFIAVTILQEDWLKQVDFGDFVFLFVVTVLRIFRCV